jgi:hypothetical protein
MFLQKGKQFPVELVPVPVFVNHIFTVVVHIEISFYSEDKNMVFGHTISYGKRF